MRDLIEEYAELVEAYEITRAGKKIGSESTLHRAMVAARYSVMDSRGSKGPTIVTHKGKVVWHSLKDKWYKHSAFLKKSTRDLAKNK
jgi:hypothetical protein